jgi:hypothetical protein
MAGPVSSYTPLESSYGSYSSQSMYPSGAGGTISSGYGSSYSGSYGYWFSPLNILEEMISLFFKPCAYKGFLRKFIV